MNKQERIDAFRAEQKAVAKASARFIAELNKKHPITYMDGNNMVRRYPDGTIEVLKTY